MKIELIKYEPFIESTWPEVFSTKVCMMISSKGITFETGVFLENLENPEVGHYWTRKGDTEKTVIYPFAWFKITVKDLKDEAVLLKKLNSNKKAEFILSIPNF